jgi:hypothetical protein
MDRTTQGPPDCQDAPWAHSSRPRTPPSTPVCQPEFIPAQKVSLASRSKGTLSGQLNVRHAFNMTRGTSNDRSLTDTDGITIVQNPIRLRPVSVYSTTLGYLSKFTNTANHSQVFTYNSQVTGNHPTSTDLSMAKRITRS